MQTYITEQRSEVEELLYGGAAEQILEVKELTLEGRAGHPGKPRNIMILEVAAVVEKFMNGQILSDIEVMAIKTFLIDSGIVLSSTQERTAAFAFVRDPNRFVQVLDAAEQQFREYKKED